MKIDTTVIQQPTYDEFGHVVANDRSGAAADMHYAYAKDATDYCGSLILRNAHPSQYLFAGGYASFDADTLSGWHYYVQDYMGNNRMVVNANTNSVEQETHYYPYGGVIGDISTNESLQSYKFEGKVLAAIEKIDNLRREDEPLGEGQACTFGLDWYDIQARQYDAIGGTWYAIDPLAEKTPEMSPYAMCAGNPVNFGDYDGETYYDVADNGKVVKREDEHVNDDMDVLFAKNDRSIKIEDKSILNSLSKEEQATSTSVELLSLFFFVASNTSVEWRVSGWENGDFALKTDQKISESSMPINNENSSPKWVDMHSHPGFDDSDDGTKGGSNPDMATFNCAETIRKEKNQNMYLAFVYHTRTDMTYRYNSGGSTMYWNCSR